MLIPKETSEDEGTPQLWLAAKFQSLYFCWYFHPEFPPSRSNPDVGQVVVSNIFYFHPYLGK